MVLLHLSSGSKSYKSLLSFNEKTAIALTSFSTFAGKAFSQVVGDYRSASSGVWSTVATWQRWNGSAWAVPASAPGATNNVKILNGHTITVSTSGAPCADLVVDAGVNYFVMVL